MFPAYRNQSIDLQCKSIDWFLFEGNIDMKKVKKWRHTKCVMKFSISRLHLELSKTAKTTHR